MNGRTVVHVRKVSNGPRGKDIWRAYILHNGTLVPLYMGAYTAPKVIERIQAQWPEQQFKFVIEGEKLRAFAAAV